MRRCGDVELADLGEPQGREVGFARPVVILTAQVVLDQHPSIVQVAPLTSRLRGYATEVRVDPDEGNGLGVASAVQCQHIRAVAVGRLIEPVGNVGPERLALIRETIADLLDL